jgi:hypothetical protein
MSFFRLHNIHPLPFIELVVQHATQATLLIHRRAKSRTSHQLVSLVLFRVLSPASASLSIHNYRTKAFFD